MPCACCGKFVAEAVDDGTLFGWIAIPDDVLVEVPWGEYCDRMHGKWYFFLCDSCGLDAYDDWRCPPSRSPLNCSHGGGVSTASGRAHGFVSRRGGLNDTAKGA